MVASSIEFNWDAIADCFGPGGRLQSFACRPYKSLGVQISCDDRNGDPHVTHFEMRQTGEKLPEGLMRHMDRLARQQGGSTVVAWTEDRNIALVNRCHIKGEMARLLGYEGSNGAIMEDVDIEALRRYNQLWWSHYAHK